ncbi:MAG TPA: MEMO1 family protein [Candidatus Syntrophoarchaeum butanivorans]|uniref:MEMO1 family protein ENG09_06895 n=1 Tax=Candidatus Syntropharchaeum butanivorans TaxID=1839936 RepID=A0A7C1B8E9_9EURY|nr:MEMO1 family protein [Candidatus Syntrophoarchaeum butanivorans]
MRFPAVAGQFYPGEADELIRLIKNLFSGITISPDGTIKGAIVPHAGYIYSGRVAATVFARLPAADTFIITCPNHHGLGSVVAASRDVWRTPLGDVEVDLEMVDALAKRIIDLDETAHRYEHACEVQLPFLQYLFEDFRILPVSIGLRDEKTAMEVGLELKDAIDATGKKVVILASSDFTHYEPDRVARVKDEYVIEPILRLDRGEFYRRIYERGVSACGVDPIGAMLTATRAMGAREGELLMYATSGDVSGDYTSVVGYAGIVIR